MDIVFQLGLVILLVILNGFFVASEFGLVAIRKTRVDELANKGNRPAKLIQKALYALDTYISATQLGITIASLALGWIGEPVIAHMLEPFLAIYLSHSLATFSAHSISIAIAFFSITFLHIVIGELVPKSIALQRSEKTTLFIIGPLTAFTYLFRPIIWILNKSGLLITRVFGLSSPLSTESVHSEEEIKMLLSQSGRSGEIAKDEVEMVYNVFQLGDTMVKQIMVPRTDIVSFNVATTLSDVIKRIGKNVHSRFPVYEHSIDTIIGFIHVKDIYKAALTVDKKKKLSEMTIIRNIITVPESKKANEVLIEMRKKRVHLAVVNDEYGGTAGIVTLEDVLESLVGDIQDEFEKPEEPIQKQKDGSFLIDGLVPVKTVIMKFNLPMKGQGYSTIGGLVFGLLGHQPKVNEKVQISNIIFAVEKMEKKRIKTIKLTIEEKRKNTGKKNV
jgi:CBS domain containing-hemolysin-like protein